MSPELNDGTPRDATAELDPEAFFELSLATGNILEHRGTKTHLVKYDSTTAEQSYRELSLSEDIRVIIARNDDLRTRAREFTIHLSLPNPKNRMEDEVTFTWSQFTGKTKIRKKPHSVFGHPQHAPKEKRMTSVDYKIIEFLLADIAEELDK